MQTTEKIQVEQVPKPGHEFSAEAEVSASVEAEGLHNSLSELADQFDVAGFKCVKCNLAHMHDTTKHRLSDSFDISESDAATLVEYNGTCHCGLQEAARRGDEVGIDQDKAANKAGNAPIPPETTREMDEELGTL